MNTVVNAAQRVYPIGYPWKDTCGKVVDGYSTAQKNAGLGAADDLQNAEPQWYRPLTVLEGLYNSINTVTFASAAQLDLCGIQKIVDATGMHSGLPSGDDPHPKIDMSTLGNLLGSTQTSPLTMASAFATFANDGKYCEPIAITSVVDATGKQLPAQSSSCRDAIKPEVARGVNYALQEVLNRGSGSLIQPRISTKTSFPIGAKTGTSNLNGSTWVVGHTTGLATAAWFGDPLGNQGRAGQNVTINGKFYQGIDGYMIAGPMFSNYMLKIAPGYGTNPFPEPPSNMVNGTTRTTTPATTAPQAPAPAPQVTQAPAPAPQVTQAPAPAPAPTSNGNGNGNGKGNG
jgi:membrane peptidoglycan carboxypeptidase